MKRHAYNPMFEGYLSALSKLQLCPNCRYPAMLSVKNQDSHKYRYYKHLCRIDRLLKNVISVFLPGLGYDLRICVLAISHIVSIYL